MKSSSIKFVSRKISPSEKVSANSMLRRASPVIVENVSIMSGIRVWPRRKAAVANSFVTRESKFDLLNSRKCENVLITMNYYYRTGFCNARAHTFTDACL